jgi:hypothetical protein
MPTYAKTTTVSADQTLLEIKKLLEQYGATGFAFAEEGQHAAVVFVFHDRRFQMPITLPDPNDPVFRYTPARRQVRRHKQQRDAYEQVVRQRWRALKLLIQAQLEAVELGMLSREEAFLTYTVLPGGQTVGQRVLPEVDRALQTGTLPPLLPGTKGETDEP